MLKSRDPSRVAWRWNTVNGINLHLVSRVKFDFERPKLVSSVAQQKTWRLFLTQHMVHLQDTVLYYTHHCLERAVDASFLFHYIMYLTK